MFDFDKVTDRRNTGSLKWDVKDGELPMWVADMDFECAPEIKKALSARVSHGIFGYTDTNDDWRNAYVNFWKRRHGFNMEGGKLLFCSGIVPAVASVIRCLTKKGDGVILMSPVYNIFFNLVKQNDREVVESELRYDCLNHSYSIDFGDFEDKMKDDRNSLLILCNPQNPVGKIWQRNDLEKIGELAGKYNVKVVSDEIHCDITAPGKSYIPFASVNEANLKNSVTCISPTKAFNLAGIQTSALYIYDDSMRKTVADSLNIDNINEPNVFAVPAVVAAFDRSEDWLDGMREYVFENRAIAEKYIKEHIPQIKAVEGDAAYLRWGDIREVLADSKRFTAFLRANTGLFITPGAVYGKNAENFVRINLACPRTTLLGGLERLKKGCDMILLKKDA